MSRPTGHRARCEDEDDLCCDWGTSALISKMCITSGVSQVTAVFVGYCAFRRLSIGFFRCACCLVSRIITQHCRQYTKFCPVVKFCQRVAVGKLYDVLVELSKPPARSPSATTGLQTARQTTTNNRCYSYSLGYTRRHTPTTE